MLPFAKPADLADVRSVGIPRALLWYRYGALWEEFFRSLGREVVLSGQTDKGVLAAGEARSVDECCLASKLYFGHAAQLVGACDALFVPAYANEGRLASFCTKFQSLPDLTACTLADEGVRTFGVFVDRVGEPPVRSAFARLFYRIINRISDADIVDGARDFRLMTRPVVDAVLAMGERNRFTKGIYGWVGFRTKWLPYENVDRAAGETKWSFLKLAVYALDGVAAFSTTPLAIASVLGVLFCLLALVLTVVVVVRAILFGDPVAGWPSLMTAILLVGGAQLLCLGVIGQYLAKTYVETKHRPIYLAREQGEGPLPRGRKNARP